MKAALEILRHVLHHILLCDKTFIIFICQNKGQKQLKWEWWIGAAIFFSKSSFDYNWTKVKESCGANKLFQACKPLYILILKCNSLPLILQLWYSFSVFSQGYCFENKTSIKNYWGKKTVLNLYWSQNFI